MFSDPIRLVTPVLLAAILSVFTTDNATAQYYHYYTPASNYGWSYQVSQPVVRSYVAPRTNRYYSSPRPLTGVGSNLHRSFMIRQEQQRFMRTGLPPRNRGNIFWVR